MAGRLVTTAIVLSQPFAIAAAATSPVDTTLQASTGAADNNNAFAAAFPVEGRPSRFGPTEGLWRDFFTSHHAAFRASFDNSSKLCDIGAADGSLTAYISEQLGLAASAYDIMLPEDNIYSAGGAHQTPVQLFDGAHIPESNDACAMTLFCYVLHHAANNTYSLLQEAVRATHPSGYVMVTEDLASPRDAERTARNLLHDDHGVFRTRDDWIALLTALGLEVLEHRPLFGSDNPQYAFLTRPARQPPSSVDTRAATELHAAAEAHTAEVGDAVRSAKALARRSTGVGSEESERRRV